MTKEGIRIRQAVPANVEAVTDLVLASMPADQDWWDYRWPYRAEHPDNYRQYFYQLVQAWLSAEYEDWIVVVADVYNEETGYYSMGAFSAWNVAYRNYRKFNEEYNPRSSKFHLEKFLLSKLCDIENLSFDPKVDDALANLPPRKDANRAHVKAHSRAVDEGHEKFIDARYGTEQCYLNALGTHPSMTRRGLARRLCRWGMDEAARDGVVVTLQSAPLARRVYPYFGFVELGEVKAQVEGEEECTFLYPMVWDPKGAKSAAA